MLIYITAAGGIVLSIIGAFLTPTIASMLGAKGQLLSNCTMYARISFISMPCIHASECIPEFLLLAEKPKLGLSVIVASGVTNIILDALFVGAFGFGLAGLCNLLQYVGNCLAVLFL